MTNSFRLTDTRTAALVDALLHGDIWKTSRSTPQGSRHYAPATINRLHEAGLIKLAHRHYRSRPGRHRDRRQALRQGGLT
jgi:hypothetical protein